ncbi:MAG: MATE family efflux transporter, partial [Wujia sp.]
ILNLLLVIVFHMKVEGVAIATAVSNLINAGIVTYLLMREEDMIKLDFRRLKIQGKYLTQVIRIGAPAAIQSAVFCLSNIILQSGINSIGADAVAGSATGLNFEYLTYAIVNSFAQATITFTSQNYGAGKNDRCKKTMLVGIAEGVVCTAVFSIIFTVWGPELVTLFTDKEKVAEFALTRMNRVMLLEWMIAFYEVPGGTLRGMGHSLLPALLTIIGSVMFRILWLFTVFEKYHTFGMLMTVYPVSWIFTTILVMTAYIGMRKKLYASL